MKRAWMILLLIGVVGLGSGCASNRGYMHLDVPKANKPENAINQVYIRSITDARVFEEKPATADIPSLGFGGLKKADAASVKSHAIARKRNGYGKAMGDILLEEQQTVPNLVYDMLKTSLYLLGYDVTNDPAQAKVDAIQFEVSVDKFWGWLTPGFWTLATSNEIMTTVQIGSAGSRAPVVIAGKEVNHCQVADTRNWQKTFRLGMQKYIEDAQKKLEPELKAK